MSSSIQMLERHLARQQGAFLARRHPGWEDHLGRMRAWLGSSLKEADVQRPVVILGAGSGLEVPWALAPPLTWGWDADPWSRMRTLLCHRRWAPWHFEDLTGAMVPLTAMLKRNVRRDWRGRILGRRSVARLRIAGLLDSLPTPSHPLATVLATLRPGLVIAANVMGQFAPVAEALVEQAFGGPPWEPDPDEPDVLAEALDRWSARVVEAFLLTLRASGADLCLVHDRAVFAEAVALGGWEPDWRRQILNALEARDPLCGVDVLALMARTPERQERWLWPVATGQVHLMEALAFSGSGSSSASGSPAR